MFNHPPTRAIPAAAHPPARRSRVPLQASMSKKVKGSEKAYVKLALSYDRFLKAGNIVPM